MTFSLFWLLTNVAVLLTRICSHLNLPYQVHRSPAAADKTPIKRSRRVTNKCLNFDRNLTSSL